MDEYLKKLASKRLEQDSSKQAIDALVSYIAANPGLQHEDLVRKAMELGHDPKALIESALGSVKIDKTGASLSQPLEDVLNQVYEENPVPGKRYVIDPTNVKSPQGKKVNQYLGGDYGVAAADRAKGGLAVPDFYAVEDSKDEARKLRTISAGGHELRHGEDWLSKPGFKITNPMSMEPGHHAGNIYESAELIREARELPIDQKLRQEVLKNSVGLKTTPFKRLASAVPVLGAGLAAYAALQSPDASAGVADTFIPGGLESLGPSSDDSIIENPQASPELRKQALMRMKNGQ